ncbi:hypothetical protein [Streptomyces sp. NPDC001070]
MLLRVPLPDSVGSERVTVRLTVTGKGSRKPFVDERTQVTLRKSQPNGPQCEPTAYQASLRYEPAEGLVAAA